MTSRRGGGLVVVASMALIAIVVAVRGRGGGSERQEAPPVVSAFEGLADVRLPTRLGDVKASRPQAQPTDFGLREAVGGIEMQYIANREPGSEQYPGDRARVEHVVAEWGAVGDDSAAKLWRSSLAQLTGALGMSAECTRGSPSPVAFARWRTASGAVAYVRREHSVTGPVRQGAAFSIGFSVDTTVLRHALADATSASCEDPFRAR